jgi:hypothetical protein
MFSPEQRGSLACGGCTDGDIEALEAHARTITPEQSQLIARIEDLMEQTGEDMTGILQHLILNSKLTNLEDAHLLAWLPPVALEEVAAWLTEEAEGLEGEADAAPEIVDLSDGDD